MIVAARRLHGYDKAARARSTPGAFYYLHRYGREGAVGMTLSCPCGCGRLRALTFTADLGHPVMRMVGAADCPTVYPHVTLLDDDGRTLHWRGRLRDGVWTTECVC